MAIDYGITLAALGDLPILGATVSGATAAAYRAARRLLQPEGGLVDLIEPEDNIEYPEANYLSLDLREYVGRDMGAQDIGELQANVTAAIREETDLDDAIVDVSFSSGTLSVTVQAFGIEGPFSFVVSVSDVTSATLRVL